MNTLYFDMESNFEKHLFENKPLSGELSQFASRCVPKNLNKQILKSVTHT